MTVFNVMTDSLLKEMSVILLEAESKRSLLNEITVCRDAEAQNWITEVIKCYSQLWEDWGNIVNISESEWINISLLNNWRELYKAEQVKVYSLRRQNRELIDKIFNKLYAED